MDRKTTIMIADRNRNVREFLKREMVSENYRVICAEDAKTMFKRALEPFMVDVLIIDPNLPDMEPSEIMRRLARRRPVLPIIVHCLSEEDDFSPPTDSVRFVEKGGGSIEVIKQILRDRTAG